MRNTTRFCLRTVVWPCIGIALGGYIVICFKMTTNCKCTTTNDNAREVYAVKNGISSLTTRSTENNNKDKIMNIYEYNFSINPNSTCKGEDVNLIFMIKSAVGNFDRRTMIRRTWANHEIMKRLNLRRIFVVGLPKKTFIETKVLQEVKNYRDILQIEFYDDYYNNTLKTTGAVNWVNAFCGEANFVLFVDDDYFVSSEKLVNYVNSPEYTKTQCVYTGSVNHDGPKRDRGSKWYISKKDYSVDTYPPFVSGGAWLASKPFVKNLSVGIEHTKRFIYDDVFIAMVARHLNVTPCHEPRFSVATISYNHIQFNTVLASSGFDNPDEVSRAWECTVNPVKKPAYPKYCVIKK